MKIKLAENIKNLRKKNVLTQEQLAEALGVTVGAVYKWEAGLSMPELRLIMELADFFEISVDVLLGYEQQNGGVERRIERIEQCIGQAEITEAVLEAEKALQKYPNHFEVVYLSARVYQLSFLKSGETSRLTRSNELFRHAITLLYQNTESSINEVTIKNHIAENYLMSEQTELALEQLKENNVCHINSSLIGFTYAKELKKPEEAKPYLVTAFADSISALIRTMAGFSYLYAQTKEQNASEPVQWLLDFLDSLKKDRNQIAFTDRLKAIVFAQYGVWAANEGAVETAENYLREAYKLAKEFEKSPVYTMSGIRFLEGENGVAFDDMSGTTTEVIQSMVFEEAKTEAVRQQVCKIWEELGNEENN